MAVTVAAVGYASADRCVQVPRLPEPDRTAIVTRRLSRPWPRLGGCAPQVAVRLAAQGVPATCVTWLAPDADGVRMLAALEAAGVATSGVAVTGTRTPEAFIAYGEDGRTACFYDPGDVHGGGLTSAQSALVTAAPVVCLTVGPPAATRAALAAAAPGAAVVWSVKADPDAYPPELVERLLARADVIAMAHGERAFVAARGGGRAPRSGALVVETRGSAGVRWEQGAAAGELPVEPVAVRDTTGAGDAFAAGLIAAWAAAAQEPEGAVRAGIATSRAFLEARGREEAEA
jgi:ribokinase